MEEVNIYVPSPDEIPDGLCECGCGKRTKIATATIRKRRHFRGHPTPFLRGHSPTRRGADHHLWKGGRLLHHTGYVLLYAPDHPEADTKGYVREHRWVMEQKLGRPLTKAEHVHHINGVKDDNRPENLEVLTKAEHNAHHAPLRHYSAEARRKMSEAGKRGAAARWGKN